jgi:putative oxygen-independent coproporphyrinogen III oxidase
MKSHIAPKPSAHFAPVSSFESKTPANEPKSEPLAVYIHWPYCESKCPYCDFNSYARRSISEAQFIEAAIRELRHYAALTSGRPVLSIFFGGGTPSLMEPRSVTTLIDEITGLWRVARGCEITLEANPSSVESARFAGYRLAGVNRVSLGVQSLKDEQLRFLGRLHTAAQARQALDVAAKHFERVSFDLIYARPEQTPGDWRNELGEALKLAHGHVSLYQLTIEPETAFFHLHRNGKFSIPGADLAADLYEITQEICESFGLPAYEVSNHAAPGCESQHNLTYWRYGDYLGIGPGAHGRVTVAGKKYATAAFKAPAAWHAGVLERGDGCQERFELGRREQAEEMVLMGLRLGEGLDIAKLEISTGHSLPGDRIDMLEADKHIECDGRTIRTSRRGRLVLNAIVETIAAGLEDGAARSIL